MDLDQIDRAKQLKAQRKLLLDKLHKATTAATIEVNLGGVRGCLLTNNPANGQGPLSKIHKDHETSIRFYATWAITRLLNLNATELRALGFEIADLPQPNHKGVAA